MLNGSHSLEAKFARLQEGWHELHELVLRRLIAHGESDVSPWGVVLSERRSHRLAPFGG